MKINTIIKTIAVLGFVSIAAGTMAATVNPYTYSVFEDAINDAKWQRGSSSQTQCVRTDCESTMDSSSNQQYIWADSSNGQLQFSTNGSQDDNWRSELRFEDNFSRGATETFTARFGYWASRSTSESLTVAQLHMESDDSYSVKGPPVRLAIIDEEYFEVKWRNSYSCSSGCWSDNRFSTSTSGWKDVQFLISGDYINVSVAGQTFSYQLDGSDKNWPSDGEYYWKTGIYLQDEGTAYTGYKNLYW